MTHNSPDRYFGEKRNFRAGTATLSKDLVIQRVTNGRDALPSFEDRLTKEQIDAVAGYVSSVAGK